MNVTIGSLKAIRLDPQIHEKAYSALHTENIISLYLKFECWMFTLCWSPVKQERPHCFWGMTHGRACWFIGWRPFLKKEFCYCVTLLTSTKRSRDLGPSQNDEIYLTSIDNLNLKLILNSCDFEEMWRKRNASELQEKLHCFRRQLLAGTWRSNNILFETVGSSSYNWKTRRLGHCCCVVVWTGRCYSPPQRLSG